MFMVFQVSKQFVARPHRVGLAAVGWSFTWLFFAIHYLPLRFDQFTFGAMRVGADMTAEEVCRMWSDHAQATS